MMVIVVIHHTVDGCEIMHQLYKCFIHLYPMISRLSTILLVQDFATIPRFLFPIASPVRPLEGLAARMGSRGEKPILRGDLHPFHEFFGKMVD